MVEWLSTSRRVFDRLSRRGKQAILIALDLLLAPASLLLTIAVIPSISAWQIDIWHFLMLSAAMIAFMLPVSFALGVHRIQLKSYEMLGALKSGVVACAAALGLWAGAAAVEVVVRSETLIFLALVLGVAMIAARHLMLRFLLALLRLGNERHNVLIYGAGLTGTQLAKALQGHHSVRVIAFIDDNPTVQGISIMGMKVYAPDRLQLLVARHSIRQVLLAMPSASVTRQNVIARSLMEAGLEVQTLPSFAQLVGSETLADALVPVQAKNLLNRAVRVDLHPEALRTYSGKCVLVSGAGGSVGSELCRQLLPYGPCRVILFEMSELALYTILSELTGREDAAGIEFIPILGSVTDQRHLLDVFKAHSVEVVLHAAAYKHVPLVEANPLSGVVNNVFGTRCIAEACQTAGIKKFVLISSDKAVRPTNVMGATKRMAELVIQDLALNSSVTDFSIVRFGNVLGSSGSVVPLFREQIKRGGPVTLTHEDVTRYFMTISEAAQLVLLAGGLPRHDSEKSGDLLVLDMGQPIRIRDLAERMINAAGFTVRDERNPQGDIPIVVTGLRPGEKLHEELLIEPGMLTTPHSRILRAREKSCSSFEIARALRDLRAAVSNGGEAEAVAVMARVVEGFVSDRSRVIAAQ
ncbi:MAG: polysaccharide biosynthesis protein [Cypionkella sp.]|jgi:FlaA1/EpsC-like NDP-sugar epimerase|nr:polysaccharide biosynthesis protein [Cypionkella sp.]